MSNNIKKKLACQIHIEFSVYVIWEKVNGKFYVGVTYQVVYKRIRQHMRGKQFVDRELRKIGWEGNVDWWVVEEHIPAEKISDCEKKWVKEFDSVYPNGYNRTLGGIGKIEVSEATRAKQREKALARDMSGANNPMYGKHHTPETRATISAKLSGENSPMYGKPPANKGVPHTEEHKAKISDALKGEKNPFYGKHHTQETKDTISKANSGKPGWNKGIPCAESTKAKLREKALARDVSGERNPFYGKKHTKETIEKNRQAQLGKHPSDETRKKISESVKAAWAKKKAEKEKAAQEKLNAQNADNQQENFDAQNSDNQQENLDAQNSDNQQENSNGNNSDNQDKTS